MLETMFENALLDYYRGGNSYEDSVKKQLNALEATSLATTFAVSDMKSDLRKELRANTNELHGIRDDIRTAAVGMHNLGQGIRNDIQDMATGVTSAIQENTYAVVASQAMLSKTFNQGFNAVNNTLDFGFTLVGKKIDVLSDEIASKLDQIQDILNNPRLTQSRELYRQALISYKKGFFEEALKDCKEAVEKNTTDFISWYLLGLIYLYGAGENSNVIDLNNSEIAFANAAKYIKPDIPKSEEAKLMASEIYYNLGISRLIKSNDYLIENKIDDSNAKLLEAENASSIAYQLSKDNLVAAYEQAKELHFLGKNEEALKLLEELIRAEKTFSLKAINDKNFESLWKNIEELIDKLKKESCDFLLSTLNDVIRVNMSMFEAEHDFIIEKIKHEKLKNEENLINDFLAQKEENVLGFNRKKDELQTKYANIEQKDYFTVLDILSKAYGVFEEFNNQVAYVISYTKNLMDDKISSEVERQEEERERELQKKREEERKRQEEIRRKQEEEEEKLEREEQRRLEEVARKKANKRKIICSIILLIGGFCILLYMRSDFRYTKLLFKAIKKYDVEKVEKYIKKGANVNAKKGKSGSTPIFYMLNSIHPGVNKRYNKIYEGFFNKLGDCKTTNVYENIRHSWLEYYKEPFQIFDLLINAGADINVANNYGVTPLMLSSYFLARCGNEETDHQIFMCIEKMLDLGADVNAKTCSGITALDINMFGHWCNEENKASNMKYKQKVIDLLRTHGAK